MKKLTIYLGILLIFSCTNSTEEIFIKGGSLEERELITLESGIQVEKYNENYYFQSDMVLSEEQLEILNSCGNTRAAINQEFARRWLGGTCVLYV